MCDTDRNDTLLQDLCTDYFDWAHHVHKFFDHVLGSTRSIQYMYIWNSDRVPQLSPMIPQLFQPHKYYDCYTR